MKKPADARILRSGGLGPSLAVAVRGNQRAHVPKVAMVIRGYSARMTSATNLEVRWAGSVRYHIGGEGELLLLLHGLAGSTRNWVELLPELVKRYRVLAVDLPGHARSGRLPRGASTADFAGVAAAVLEAEAQ